MLKQIKIPGIRKVMTLGVNVQPDLNVLGVSNECADSYYVLFGDYDQVYYEVVQKDIMHLNMVYGLCTFVTLVNNEEIVPDPTGEKVIGNYGLVSFCKVRYWDVHEMLKHCRVDMRFVNTAVKAYWNRNWVLRHSGKYDGTEVWKPEPLLKEVICMGGCEREHSLAHWKFYREMFAFTNVQRKKFDVMKKNVESWDPYKHVDCVQYRTRR